MSELGEGEEQVGSYAIYFAEGESLAKQKEFKKAVESFTKALEFQPEDKPCLVARSKCYLQLGDATTALLDAEASLKEDKNYHRGLLQKAEALYATGDFEYSLVFFHRGHKIRPDLHEFTLGIEKCQEAINNSIGTPDACTLEKVGDLSYFHQQDIMNKKKATKLQKPALKSAAAQTKAKVERKPVASEKTVKELLGELYADKEYLEKLLKDPGLATKQKDRSIQETVEGALTYLDQRTEFWRQQKPMYARKREKELKRYKPSPTRFITISKSRGQGPDQVKQVMKTLEEIDAALQGGDAEGSLAQAEKALQMVLASNDRDLPNKAEFVSSLHACIGSAQLELGNSEAAIQNFQEDLKITQQCNLGIARSRALDNLAKVYTVLGDFEKAIPYFQEKVTMATTPDENSWLFHELGRCHLELGNYDQAKAHGEKSLTAAQEGSDLAWQLNACVLVAQAEAKMGDMSAAVKSFTKALELAEMLKDEPSQEAIKKALQDISSPAVQVVQEDSKGH